MNTFNRDGGASAFIDSESGDNKMTRHEMLRITIKMSGLALVIYGAIQALSNLPLVLESLKYTDVGNTTLSYTTAMLGPVIFGLILWLVPSTVTNTVIRNDLDSQSIDRLLHGIETLAIRVMGILLLYHCLSNLILNYLSYQHHVSMNSGFSGYTGGERYLTVFYVIGFEFMMAIGLIIGSKGIANVVRKIRHPC